MAASTWLGTQYAWSGITRLVLLALGLGLLLLRPPRTRAAAVAALLAVLTLAWGGHATDSPADQPDARRPPARRRHLAGCRARGRAGDVGPRRSRTTRRSLVVRGFSRLATVALFVLIAGGSASALLLTNGLEGGLTIYVWIVLAKVGVVGIAALMGAWGRRGLARGADRGRYRRLFLLDSTLLVVVALLSSALTLVGPHQGHAGHEGHDMTSPRCSMTLGQAPSDLRRGGRRRPGHAGHERAPGLGCARAASRASPWSSLTSTPVVLGDRRAADRRMRAAGSDRRPCRSPGTGP